MNRSADVDVRAVPREVSQRGTQPIIARWPDEVRQALVPVTVRQLQRGAEMFHGPR